jgi:hypothetical protein
LSELTSTTAEVSLDSTRLVHSGSVGFILASELFALSSVQVPLRSFESLPVIMFLAVVVVLALLGAVVAKNPALGKYNITDVTVSGLSAGGMLHASLQCLTVNVEV